MGKFPGKPSKIINRKRIKVSKFSSVKEDESVKAAETIYHGLTVFNETFGNDEQIPTEFHGFTRKDVQLAVSHARLHLRDTEAECKLNGFDISLQNSFNEEISHIKLQSSPPKKTPVKNKKKQCFDGGGKCMYGEKVRSDDASPTNPLPRIRKKQCFDGGGAEQEKTSTEENEVSVETLSSGKKVFGSHHSTNNFSLKNSAAKKLLQKAMKSCHVPVTTSDSLFQDKGVNNALRKFVLPSRSAHSSRVIKPNKRFIEVDENASEVNVQSQCPVQLKRPKLMLCPMKNPEETHRNHNAFTFGESLSEKVGDHGRLGCLGFDGVSGNFSSNVDNNSLSPPHDGSLIVEGKRRWKPSYKVQLKLRELNVFGAGTSRFPFRRNLGSSTDASESVNSGSDKETISQSTSGHTTDRSESDILVTNTLSDNKMNTNTRVPGSKLTSSSKVILKEARLKLNTQTSSLSDGPFSNSMHLGASLPETVECGVCGAVRFYRFVKQARKFGIFSCESCRKFISKMIKRQACAKTSNLPPLECHKGEGMCSVPPIVRSQQWKAGRGTLVRCSYKARCPACWLKMCLRSFKMPDTTRAGLISMLPTEMQNGLTKTQTAAQCHPVPSNEDLTNRILNRPFRLGFVDIPIVESNRLPKEWPTPVPVLFQRDPFGHQRNHNQKSKQKGSNSEKQHTKQKKNEKDQTANTNSKSNSQIQSAKLIKKASKNLTAHKELRVASGSKKKKKTGTKSTRKVGGSQADHSGSTWSSHRQRVELKGPRVKHVCRSASIVLGQMPATFPAENQLVEQKTKQKTEIAKAKSKSSCCLDCKETESTALKTAAIDKLPPGRSNSVSGDASKNTSSSIPVDGKVDMAKRTLIADEAGSNVQDESNLLPLPSQSYRKVGLKNLPVTRSLPIPGKRHTPENLNQVSIDFWESYDPEEVCNTGFGLIGSEPFHVRAICFLCGSGGLEQLIHCASCCEPYHRFCLEDGLRDTGEDWRYNWICQRCTVCNTCGRGQGQQLSCQRCHKTYHTECLGSSRFHSPDRPWVCPSCLRCKSCGSAEVTVFVGNLPLCKTCFKLRQKGNYCPLCQRCYEDHDYDTKMMECAKCSCWVHAKCEGLSDEKYQVLSYLPESVEFICRMCCAMPPAPWWIAVEEELRAGYLSVLKSLSKNKKACALLKSSPKKQCLCRTAPVGKQLSFSILSGTKDNSDSRLKYECTENSPDAEDAAPNEETTIIGENTATPNEPASSRSEIIIDSKEEISTSAGLEPVLAGNIHNTTEAIQNVSSVSKAAGELLMTKYNGLSSVSMKSESSATNLETSQMDVSQSVTELPLPDSHKNPQEITCKTTALVDPALKLYWEKYNIRECSVRVEDILPKPSAKTLLPVKVEVPCNDLLQEGGFCENGKSPHKILPASLSTPCSDSGISSTDEELKSCGGMESNKELVSSDAHTISEMPSVSAEVGENGYSSSNGEENPVSESEGVVSETSNDTCLEKVCHCLEVTQSKPSLTLLSVKKKVNGSEYSSLLQFHQEMESLISRSQAGELLETYHHTLHEVFPWFDPKYARVSSRPMHEDHFYCQSPNKLLSVESCDNSFNDDSKVFSETGKENLEDKVAKLLLGKDQTYYYSGSCVPDVRICVLCKGVGDGPSTEEGRLLYCGQNEWAHTNCALWSAEVFEEIDGSLQNVHSAVSRGRMIRCPWCEKRGASVGCCARNCNETYHFPCARKAKCTFMDDKNVYCPTHARDAMGKILLLDSEFDVRRPIYVELDRKKKKFSEVQKVKFMIGSLLVESLGEFVSGVSDHHDVILPNGFRCTRYFWSSVEPWRVVQYQVKTIVNQQLPEQAEDLGWNITIDHSLDEETVQQKLNEVAQWYREFPSMQSRRTGSMSKYIPLEGIEQKSREKFLISNVVKNVPSKTEDHVARQVVTYLLDTICNNNVDDSCLTDPQSTADILPPELKDAIFEELPHDLLDGISMQDIFPKLMSYEDAVGIDFKSDGSCGSDGLKEGKEDLPDDVILATDVEAISMLTRGKKIDPSVMELGPHTENWFLCGDAKEQVQQFVDDLPPLNAKNSMQKYGNRELKRSKSEVLSQATCRKPATSSRGQQRSCSLAWSCKLDGSAASHSKRRKGNRASATSRSSESNTSSDALGNERAHMLQELRLLESGLSSLPRTSTASASASTVEGMRELKMRLEDEASTAQGDRRKSGHPKEEGKENKWLLWHSRSQARILQLDGTVDSSSSGSEGGKSPRRIDDDDDDDCSNHRVRTYPPAMPRRGLPPNILNKDGDDEPVRCSRCHRTYRTRTSFERHLPTCSSDFILSTSESDSENTRSSEEESPKQMYNDDTPKVTGLKCEFKVQNESNTLVPSLPILKVTAESQESTQTSPVDSQSKGTSTVPSQSLTTEKTEIVASKTQDSEAEVLQSSLLSHITTTSSSTILSSATSHNSQSSRTSTTTTTTTTTTSSQFKSQVAPQPLIPSVVKSNCQSIPGSLNVHHTQVSSTVRAKPTGGRSRTRVSARGASRQTARNITCQPAVTATATPTAGAQYQMHMVHTPCAQAPAQPTVFVQQVPSPSVVPAFVEAFQQHTGQSLQYIATIDAHSKHPFITPTTGSIVPGTFQLQASPDGFTGMQNNSIPVMPGVQINTPQPTVLGTIIPQAQPAAIQCGMVAAEQMVLGSTPGVEVYTDQNGGMFVASQPMFIGLETIVSNTVMQSQQIVSSALPGVMAASSSFSATTTQVFQASKLEPIVDVPSGFVIVNPQTSDARLRNPDVVTCATAHVPMSLPSHMTPHQPPVVTHHPPVSAPIPPPPPVPAALPIPLPPPCPVQRHLPVSVTQSPVVSEHQNVSWRYTREFPSESNTYTPIHRNSDSYVSQAPLQCVANNFSASINNNSTSNSSLPVSKTVVTVSSLPQPVTISSQQTNSPVKVVKTISTVCSTESQQQTISDLQTLKLQNSEKTPISKVEIIAPQSNVTVQKVEVQADDKSNVPVVNKPVTQNSKTNTIKLVLQKQTQDGLYKITPNQGVRILSATKQPIATAPVSKYAKPKPRPVAVIEKRKDQENHYLPAVLQPSQNNNNGILNGAVNGTKHIPNGKLSFLKEISPPKDVSPSITFELRSQDGFCCTSSDITEVWQKVFEAVQQARVAHRMPPLPQNPFMATQDGVQMLGLKHNGLRYLVEQLPGAGRCIKYKPRYHKQHPPCPDDDVDALPPENKTGSARSQPFSKRSPYDMFSWLASRHRQPPKFIVNADGESISNRRATSSNLPMAMRFRHLKETSKEAVGVYRSHIHGRGLFCLRDIEAGEMVIEYAGEVIRSTLTDKREKLYESKGIGCYMFRIDDQLVVDATMRGNAARFINHSCEPNCYSRVVDILGKKHILIFALRRIPQGEELTYDYKFPFEDVKIPCTCGSRRCRKYLN